MRSLKFKVQSSKFKSSDRGFTLIELLVAVTILVILLTIAIISYANLQKNTRDSRRKADFAAIQSALEQYHADQGFYPISDKLIVGQPLNNCTGNIAGCGISKTYMGVIPVPLSTDAPYYYKGYLTNCTNADKASYCTSYCLYTKVENPGSNSNFNLRPQACNGLGDNETYYQTSP